VSGAFARDRRTRRLPDDAPGLLTDELAALVDPRTRDLAERRRRSLLHRRGWLVRRALIVADVTGLVAAFVIAEWVFGDNRTPWQNALGSRSEFVVFFATLPLWLLVAALYGLYNRDEERTDHSTSDDFASIFHMVTVGAWVLMGGAWLTRLAQPQFPKLLTFWACAVVLVTLTRSLARHLCRRSASYIQNTLIVGSGPVGALIARKLVQHPEYGLNIVGFVDATGDKPPLVRLPMLGSLDQIAPLVAALDVERVIVTPNGEADDEAVQVVHDLNALDVQIDIVPRMFEVVGPRVGIHAVEGIPVLGLPPRRPPRSSLLVKRAIDIVGAMIALVALSPVFAIAAWRIRRESRGPIFFRQTRLGLDQREFTMLKFRTMKVDSDPDSHREYIASIMTRDAAPQAHGLFKLERASEVTPFGRWLRKTSLDELPQLLNVLRGDMSLVGPRPCLPYEREHFKPHHFERFNVPPGLTGLWQVTARARSTFVEALEMDVAYARGWSLGLDLRLLARTPLQMLSKSGTT